MVKSIFWTPRHEFIFYSALPFDGRSHLMKSIFLTFEANGFIFYSALLFHEVDLVDPEARDYLLQCSSCSGVDLLDPEARVALFPLLWVPSFGEVDFVDPEVRIYFLQCSPCGEVDLLDPEARVCLVSLVVGALIRWSRSC